MRMESLGLLPSKPTHNKQQATFNVGNSFELATVVELLALRGYEVIGVEMGQIHKGQLRSNMPWAEMLELKGKAMGTCLPTYSGEKKAADKKAADLKARNEVQSAENYNHRMRKIFGVSPVTKPSADPY